MKKTLLIVVLVICIAICAGLSIKYYKNSLTGSVIDAVSSPTDTLINSTKLQDNTQTNTINNVIEGNSNMADNSVSNNNTNTQEIPAPTPYYFSRTLKLGYKGNDVSELQTILGISPTGYFGSITLSKLKSWQAANGLVPDGIFGNASIIKISENNNSDSAYVGDCAGLNYDCGNYKKCCAGLTCKKDSKPVGTIYYSHCTNSSSQE